MKASLFGPFENLTEDPDLYKTFQPQLEAYRSRLQEGILEEFKLPDSLVPDKFGYDVTRIAEKIMSDREIEITEMSASKLVELLTSGNLTSVEATRAFAKRATAAHQLVNCCMEMFIEEGLERAQYLDDYYKKTGKPIGPLHGLPISVKEQFLYKGKRCNGAYVGMIDNFVDEWAILLKILYESGAVFYVRTTEPQTTMHLCSGNNITGICRNPHNTKLTSGGSSSGEGAITAMKGSAIGVAADIGGSIRSPAAFCGVWGIRPTQKRLPLKGVFSAKEGKNEGVICVSGPIARSPQDIELFMKTVIDSEPWNIDADLIPLPWRELEPPSVKTLKVAICYDDGVVAPTPPVLRALKHAAAKLSKAGAEVIEWTPLNVESLIACCNTIYSAGENQGLKKALALSGEPVLELSKVAMSFGCGDDLLTANDIFQLAAYRDKQRDVYLTAMNQLGVDYILCPAYVNVAPEPETCHYWGYTALWNLLDFPNVVFPSGLKCDQRLDPKTTYKERSSIEAYEHGLYDPKVFEGAPIALQLTGRRWKDEELLQAAKVVSDTIFE
ncbi:hypothetical protein OGAPHI_000874 [Ogataea philodendri]|uniref:amidase n=1 Tax=Ogataea philodendri TaxID=1378263 RepID=A0A9P8T9B2_9ASCO|nr:uncharacterized protein OGAPHI_000874 [Ogataea philodendri]KAH3671163.1 hypothetical protein OGAPHI_000874 [Ogataea philodendri]